MRPIRLAFAGASGTGKSTIAKTIATMYELPMCPIGSREVSKAMGFDSPYDVDQAGRRRDFQKRLNAEKSIWENGVRGGFVTDRTHLDNLAYTAIHDDGLANDADFVESIVSSMQIYTHVVFCPVRSFCNLAGDPARVAGMAYHHRYEEILWKLLLDPHGGTRFDILVLGAKDLDERIEKVRMFVRT